MTPLESHERRITKLETRVTEVETGYDETMYKLRRAIARIDIKTSKMAGRMDIEDTTADEIDEALDED